MYKIYPKDVNIEPIANDEYFVPLKYYKDKLISSKYLISNYCRIIYPSTNKYKFIKIKLGKGISMVSLNENGCSDTISLTKLMMYNFSNDNYKEHVNYYVKDVDKPLSLDNITTKPPIKKRLTENEILLLRKMLSDGLTMKEINKKIKENHMPINQSIDFVRKQKSSSNRKYRKKDISIIDKSMSELFENELDKLTNENLLNNRLTTIVKNICNKYNIKFNMNLYSRARNYLYGNTLNCNIYKDEKFND